MYVTEDLKKYKENAKKNEAETQTGYFCFIQLL